MPTVEELASRYLRKRASELRPGGYKSVRYSVELFASKFGERPITAVSREDGRWFTTVLPDLSKASGKSWRTRGLSLLYLGFAILSPSPSLAEVGDGAVYGV